MKGFTIGSLGAIASFLLTLVPNIAIIVGLAGVRALVAMAIWNSGIAPAMDFQQISFRSAVLIFLLVSLAKDVSGKSEEGLLKTFLTNTIAMLIGSAQTFFAAMVIIAMEEDIMVLTVSACIVVLTIATLAGIGIVGIKETE